MSWWRTTCLAVLALLDSPTSGRHWLNGRATETLSPGERARVRNLDVGSGR
jgi:ABC-type lipoprotein export system ATPase subunit